MSDGPILTMCRGHPELRLLPRTACVHLHSLLTVKTAIGTPCLPGSVNRGIGSKGSRASAIQLDLRPLTPSPLSADRVSRGAAR